MSWWVRPFEWLVAGLVLGSALARLRPTGDTLVAWVFLAVGLLLLVRLIYTERRMRR